MTINKNSSAYFIVFFTVVIFGFILALFFVNEKLKNQIQQAKKQELVNALNQQLECKNFTSQILNKKEYFYCKNSNIIAMHSFSNGYIDKIEYLVTFDISTKYVKNINIINHKETPGLGDKISNKQWLANIYNKSLELLNLKRDGGTIDAFTAASVTPNKFLRNLRSNIKWLTKNQQQIIKTIKE